MKSAAATLTLAILLGATGFAQDRAVEPAGPVGTPRTAPLALTPAEYNNTVADLLGFSRDGERWPARPPLADTLSWKLKSESGSRHSGGRTSPPARRAKRSR